MNLEFKGKYLIKGKLICKTGMHIGGSTEGFEIGGVDNPVIKDPLTDQPYIPGSSLKGKLRHLLEWAQGRHGFTTKSPQFTEGQKPSGEPTFQPCSCGQCEACTLFGVTPQTGVREEKEVNQTNRQSHSIRIEVEVEEQGQKLKKGFFVTGPSRLTVRDAFLTRDKDDKEPKRFYNSEELTALLGEDLYTEIKTENALDRVTSEANPRPMERVPAGAAFDVEMIFDVYHSNDKSLLKSLFTAMLLLENSALGGSGSRGHGKVEFADLKVEVRPVGYYRNGDAVNEVKDLPSSVKEVIKQFDALNWNFPS
jgi:CRISPR-associated protein Csm3